MKLYKICRNCLHRNGWLQDFFQWKLPRTINRNAFRVSNFPWKLCTTHAWVNSSFLKEQFFNEIVLDIRLYSCIIKRADLVGVFVNLTKKLLYQFSVNFLSYHFGIREDPCTTSHVPENWIILRSLQCISMGTKIETVIKLNNSQLEVNEVANWQHFDKSEDIWWNVSDTGEIWR